MQSFRPALVFLGLALLLGAPLAALFAWTGPGLVGTLVLVGYMATPLIASVILARRDGVPLKEALGLRPRKSWAWLGAVLVPMGVALASIGASLPMPGVELSLDWSGLLETLPPEQAELARSQIALLPSPLVLLPVMLLQAVVAGFTINGLAAFGEEAGWRGWLHRELRPLGFWTSSLAIGSAWGLWHAPLILQGYNYPDHPVVGVFFMTAMCLGLSPAMTWVRDATESSLAAAVFHGVFNALAGLPLMYLAGGSDLTVGVLGAAGLGVLAALNLGIWVARRGRS